MIQVMIVDDELIMRQGLKHIIEWEKEGYEIIGEASNGKEALRFLEKKQPHIIISDVEMPELDGVDFVDAVRKLYPYIKVVILSEHDKFEYVKRTLQSGVVDYVLKSTLSPEKLKEVLAKAVLQMPRYMYEDEDVFYYERELQEFLTNSHKVIDLPENFFSYNCFRMYALNFRKKNSVGKDMSEVLLNKIDRELEKYTRVRKVFLIIIEEILCVILNYDENEQDNVKQLLTDLNKQLTILNENTFGVCSSSFVSVDMMKEIFDAEILKNIDKEFYYEGQNMMFVENKRVDIAVNEIDKFDFYEYNQLLISKNYDKAIRYLWEYNNEHLRAQADVYSLKNQMKNMICHFLDLVAISAEEKEKYRNQYYLDIDKAKYESLYGEIIENIFEELKNLADSVKEQSNLRIAQILEYISRNYQEDLKLKDLAEEFNFNYNYLSAYFNQQMQEGFGDYLNRLRIEKACGLLVETGASVSRISEEVGYSDHSYFCRVFKKLIGKMPSEYRRSRNADNSKNEQ